MAVTTGSVWCCCRESHNLCIGKGFFEFCIVDPDGMCCCHAAHESTKDIHILVIGKVVDPLCYCDMFLAPLMECGVKQKGLLLSAGQGFKMHFVVGGVIAV